MNTVLYENDDTLLGMLALKAVLGDERTYLEYPRRELLADASPA